MGRTYSTDLGIDEEIQKHGPAIIKMLAKGITAHRVICNAIGCREILVRKLRYEMWERGLIRGGPFSDVHSRPAYDKAMDARPEQKQPDGNSGPREFAARWNVNEVPESLRRTVFKMHKGGWLTAKIADYMSGIMRGQVLPSQARELLVILHGSVDAYQYAEQQAKYNQTLMATDEHRHTVDIGREIK